jgi:hypothetical protein
MNARLLAAGQNGSPDTPGISIAATFTFLNGTPITVTSGDITSGNVNFSISEPVVLGSIGEFTEWLHKKFAGFPDITGEIANLQTEVNSNPLLSGLIDGFDAFMKGIITITVLSILRTKTNYAIQFAVTLDMTQDPINFFDVVQFDSIGISVSKSGTSS